MKRKNMNANSAILNHTNALEILLFHINAKNVIKLLVLFSLLITYFNISFSQTWLSGWLYRIPITITERSGNTLTDYQVLITLDTLSLISQGKMRNDCGDIRFTDSDGITLLNYWIESGCNTNNTRIWVKVPNIPANSNKIIYLYYGNPYATSMSNGDLVFEFFDDFEGTSLNTSKWIIEYSHFPYTVSNGILYIDLRSTENLRSTTFRARLPFSLSDTNVRNYVFEAYVRVNGIPNSDTSWVLSGFAVGRGGGSHNWDYNFIVGWEGVNDRFALHSWIGSMQSIHLQVNNNQWYIYYLHVVSNNNATGCIGNVCANANWDIGSGTYYLRIGGQGSYSEYWYDWVRVRKYTSPEPTITLGNEEDETIIIIVYSPENITYYTNVITINTTINSNYYYSIKFLLNNNEIYSANNLVGRNNIVFNYTLSEEGTYNLTVIANIADLNYVKTSSVIFTFKPTTTIQILSPQNTTYITIPNASIQINSTIPHNVYVYLDNNLIFQQSYNASNKTINIPLNINQEKTYNLTVLVNSSTVKNHFNQSSVIFTFKVIINIQIHSPQNTTYFSNIIPVNITTYSNINYTISIYLNNKLIYSDFSFSLGGNVIYPNIGEKNIRLNLNLNLEDTYNLIVILDTIGGHTQSSSVIFTFKGISIIQILSPQNTTYYSNIINASIQINSTIPHNVYIYLDGSLIFSQSYNASNNTINLQLNLSQEKAYNLTVLVNSSVITNHINRSSVIFTLNLYDLIVSYSNFTLFNNVNYTQTLNYLITYRCGLLNAQKNIYLFVNETINKTYSIICDNSTRTITDKLNLSTDGFYNIRFSLETHRNTPSTTFYFDNTPPIVNISYSIQTLFRTDITQTATYYANDVTYAICTLRLNNVTANAILKNNQTTLTADLIDGKNVFEIICRDIVNNTNKLSIVEDLYVKNITLWEEIENRIFNTSTLTNFNSLLIKSEVTGATYDFKTNNRSNIFYVNFRNTSDTLRLEFSFSNTADTILRIFDVDLIDSNLRICIHEQSTTYTEIYFVSSSQQKIALINSISSCEVLNTRTKYLLQNSLAVKAYTLRTTYYLYKIDENNKKIFLALIDGSIAQIVNLDALQYFTKTLLTFFSEDITAEKVDDHTIRIYYKNLRNNNEYAIFRIYADNKKIFEHEEFDNPNEFVLYFNFYGLNISDILMFEVESNNGKFMRYFNKDAKVGILSAETAITLAVLVYLFGATISVRLQLGILGLIFSLISIAILSLSIPTALTTFFIVIFLILAIFHIIVIRENVHIVT